MEYIYSRVLFSKKKNGILSFVATRMNLENLKVNEISQTQRAKYLMFLLRLGS